MERERNSLSEEGRSSPGDPESEKSQDSSTRHTGDLHSAARDVRNRTHQTPSISKSDSNPIGPASAANAGGFLQVAVSKANRPAHQTTPDARLVPVHFRYSARTSRSFGFHRRACGSVKWILSGCAVGRSGERQFPETELEYC